MIDTLGAELEPARALRAYGGFDLRQASYAVAMLYRPLDEDVPVALQTILAALDRLPRRPLCCSRIIPGRAGSRSGSWALAVGAEVVELLGYLEMLFVTGSAAVVLTDSGGLQEKAMALGVQCVTLRESAERPVTVTEGTNRVAPWPLSIEGVLELFAAAKVSR